MREGDIETSSLMASLPFLASPLLPATSSPTGFPHLPLLWFQSEGWNLEQNRVGTQKRLSQEMKAGIAGKKEKTAAMDDLRAREARSWALLVQPGMAVGSWGLAWGGVATEVLKGVAGS